MALDGPCRPPAVHVPWWRRRRERIVAFARAGKPPETGFCGRFGRRRASAATRYPLGSQRFLKPDGVGLGRGTHGHGLEMAAATRSARRANRSISPAGSRSMAALPRAPAWCRTCPRPAPRSRSTIPTRCRPSCGWRFRATRGPGGPVKWSGAAASPSASSSSGSRRALARRRDKRRRCENPSLPACCRRGAAGVHVGAGRAARHQQRRQARSSPDKSAAAEGRAMRAIPAPAYGAGFVKVEGTRYLREDRWRASASASAPPAVRDAETLPPCSRHRRRDELRKSRPAGELREPALEMRQASAWLMPSTPNQRRA